MFGKDATNDPKIKVSSCVFLIQGHIQLSIWTPLTLSCGRSHGVVLFSLAKLRFTCLESTVWRPKGHHQAILGLCGGTPFRRLQFYHPLSLSLFCSSEHANHCLWHMQLGTATMCEIVHALLSKTADFWLPKKGSRRPTFLTIRSLQTSAPPGFTGRSILAK